MDKLCENCNLVINKNAMRCKACANKNRTGKYKVNKIGKQNIKTGVLESFKKGRIVWNKGLTKDTDIRIRNQIENTDYKAGKRVEAIRNSKLGKKRIFSESWKHNLGMANKRNGKWIKENNPGWKNVLERPYPSTHHGIKQSEWKKLRQMVFNIRGKTCEFCLTEAVPPTIDHIIPYRLTKDNSLENLQVLCRSCHASKELSYSPKELYHKQGGIY